MTQAERWANNRRSPSGTYTTRPGDSLASIAQRHHTDAGEIASLNRGAVISVTEIENVSSGEHSLARFIDLLSSDSGKSILSIAEVGRKLEDQELVPGQALTVPVEPPYDPRQWADWLLWALIGVSAYLLIEIAKGLREVVSGGGNFLGETSWYYTQLAVGPLIAFVILLLFTHIDVDLLAGEGPAVEVNLNRYPPDLLIVPAFLLGFYSRVAREILDQLMRGIFRSAWLAAHDGIEVIVRGQEGDDLIDSPVVFETRPVTVVAWSATKGKIEPGGQFTPPAVDGPETVHVTATAASGGEAVTKTVTVVKHKFAVVVTEPTNGEVAPGGKINVEIKPTPTSGGDQVTWQVEPTPSAPDHLSPGERLECTASASVKPGDTITVTATYAGLTRPRELRVIAKPQTGGEFPPEEQPSTPEARAAS